MRFRAVNFAIIVCVALSCAAGLATAGAQLWLGHGGKVKPEASAHPDDLIQSILSLNLCVDGSGAYPCPVPLLSDNVYLPAITLTYGQVLDGVVTFGAVGGPDPTSGTITLYKDAEAVCVLILGVDAACPANSTIFDVGDYTLSATFTFPPGSAYANFNTSVGPCATTPTCDVTVSIAKDNSTIALKSSASPAAQGAPVTFTAIVTGEFPATPTGQVTFSVDGGALPGMRLDPTGAASFTTSTLGLGSHRISASYGGATDFNATTEDAALTQQIVSPATSTTIVSSQNPSNVGDSVTFTSTIATDSALGIIPTGSVTFKDGTASFATVLVAPKGVQNVAQTTISTLGAGTHSITAIYSGDAATSASVSPVLVQRVNYPLTVPPTGYTIAVTPVPVVMGAGQTAHLSVTVTPLSGFSGAVKLSCSQLPNESACTFGEETIPAGGGSTMLGLSTMAPHDCGSNVPYGGYQASLRRPHLGRGAGNALGSSAAALAGVFLLVLPFKRRLRIQLLLMLIAAGISVGMVGCGGNCTDFGTSPGSYTFNVRGAALNSTPVTSSDKTPDGGTSTTDVSISVSVTIKL